ncbi:MAG TPA: DoxX family protein [Longimicrobiaceae bacterium]|nr:DoxX family protein [Longimicrobiaceae bacterium]
MDGFFMRRFEEATLALLRVAAGLLFMQHGAQKLFGALGGAGPEGGAVPLVSLMGLAGVLEFFGGLLVAFGLFTRPVAFILAGQMAVAYFRAHAPQGFWPILNGGELAALYSFVFLYLSARGGGRYSLDGLIGRGRTAPETHTARV